MKLPGFSQDKEISTNQSSQLALRITPAHIQGAIWTKTGEISDVLAISSLVTYVEDDINSLVSQADLVLGECIEQLPENIDEPHHVLFGLPSTWTVNGTLTEQGRLALRQLTMKLELQAMGTVGNMEAIVNFMSVHHGVVNGILLAIDDTQMEIGLVAQGMVSNVANFKRSNDFVTDVKQAIGDFKQAHLPPKIILCGTDQDLNSLHQQLVSQPWQDLAVGFLHLPDIVTLPVNLPLEAIIFATEPQGLAQTNSPENAAEEAEEVVESEDGEDDTTEEEAAGEEVTPEQFESNERDLNRDDGLIEQERLNSLGFVKNQDIREVTEDAFGENNRVEENLGVASPREVESHVVEIAPEPKKVNRLWQKSKETLDQPAIVKKKKLKSLRWIIISTICIILIASLGGIAYAVWRSSSAEIEIKVKGTNLQESFVVQMDIAKEIADVDAGVMPAKILEAKVEGETSVNVTGKSTTGDKAKGDVTIFNDTDTVRTLAAGTKLTTSDGKNLVFVLDTSVQIASKSVDLANQNSPFSPGVAKAKVTADKIGLDSNIGAQTAMSVANFSSSTLIARSDGAFVGGSSREIRVVAKVDQQAAMEQLKKQLLEEAKNKILAEKESNVQIVDSSVETQWTDQTFSQDLNKEAEKLTASGTLVYKVVGYSTADINMVAQEKLLGNNKTDQDLIGDIKTDFKINEGSSSAGIYNFDVSASARLMPKLVPEKIVQKIAGQNVTDMDLYLHSLTSVTEIKTSRHPAFPWILNRYPPNPEKIQVTIIPE